MNNQFELGTPLNIQWHFKRPDGENYSLAGQQPTLYCINARGRFMVPSVVMNAEGGYLSFTLDRRMQVCSGEYSFLLQLRQNGVRVNDVIYRDAVTLVRTGTAMTTQEAAYNNVPPTIQLFTVGEFNLYTPTAPVGGADGYWYFNGQRILDETDTEVAAYFSLKFTREGENRGRITIYKGNADVDVEPVVVDTFDAVKVALDTVDYEMDPDNDGEEQGDHESWAHKVEVTWQDNETTRQSQESTRQSNETTRKNNEGIGTTDAECAAGSRRKNESIRVANESTRQSQEGTRQSNETTRGQKETARQKAEGQLGSSDPDYDTSRIKNELDRQEAESRRQTNEGIGATDAECAAGSRRKNESIRQTNEATRQAQEGSATDEPSASGSRWARYKYNEGTDAGSEAGDASRWGKFKEQEGTLDSSEADDGSRWGQYKEEEGTEDSSYTEHSRWGNYRAAEITRGNDYSEAEGTADGSTSGDGSRWGSYKLQEGANTDAASASGSRWARYKKAENDRETAYGTAEGSATDSPSASGSRWARFNKAQADRDQAIAPAIGIYDCDTAAATADKTVSASDYILASGGAIKIKFQYANSAASPTLNINSQGAKAIVFNGAVASASNTWGAGEVVEFYYDPTYNSNAGGFIGRSTVVRVSQNTTTGHTDINIGGNSYPVASVEDVSQLEQEVSPASVFKDYSLKGNGYLLPNISEMSGKTLLILVKTGIDIPEGGIEVYRNGAYSAEDKIVITQKNTWYEFSPLTDAEIRLYGNYPSSVRVEGDFYLIDRDSSFVDTVKNDIATEFETEYLQSQITGVQNNFNTFLAQSLWSCGQTLLQNHHVIRTGITSVVGKKYYVFVPSFVIIPEGGHVEFYADGSYDNRIEITQTNTVYEFTAQTARELSVWSEAGDSIENFVLYFSDSAFQQLFYSGIGPFADRFNIKDSQYQNMRVSEWNIGYWNNGVKHQEGNQYGVPNAEVDTYLPRVKSLLTKICSEILVITEWVTYFDQNYTMDSYNTLLKQFYPYKYTDRGDNKPAIFSKYPFVGSVGTFIHGGEYSKGVLTINGKEIIIVALHLTSAADGVSIRTQNCQDIVDEYADAPYVIVTGDFNNYPNDNQAELQPFVTAGWNLGNCGYWGKLNTYNPNYPQDPGEWYIDNVITKGLNIDDFIVVTDDERAGVSDHYPVNSPVSGIV